MKYSRAYAIAEKEVLHILRDPFTLALALLLPVMMVTIFGLAIEFNVKNLSVSVYDGDRSHSSRQLTEAMGSSGYFITEPAASQRDAIQRVQNGQVRAALIIEPQFANHVRTGGARAQVVVDGSDSSTVASVLGYLSGIQKIASEKIGGSLPALPVSIKTRFLYNPELNSRWFTVPGLMVMVLSIMSILLTALTVAREWENGSMELLLTTPLEPLEIIIGKLSPYMGLGLAAVAVVYFVARVFMHVPFRGNLLVFLLGCVLFLCTYLAQGLLISVLTRKQQLSMQFSMMSGFLPATLLSGFIFPIESMPRFFRILTAILPARWFTQISRGVFLQGSGLIELRVPFLALLIISTVMIALAARKFKTDLEP